jgi:hypothetical protein
MSACSVVATSPMRQAFETGPCVDAMAKQFEVPEREFHEFSAINMYDTSISGRSFYDKKFGDFK